MPCLICNDERWALRLKRRRLYLPASWRRPQKGERIVPCPLCNVPPKVPDAPA